MPPGKLFAAGDIGLLQAGPRVSVIGTRKPGSHLACDGHRGGWRTQLTIHQGWEALRLGRPLFLMESLLKDASFAWPKEMISYGAQVLSRDSLEALFERLPQGSLSADMPF
jgi:hypothetical protein